MASPTSPRAERLRLSNEFIRELVLSRPIPERLIRDLGDVELVSPRRRSKTVAMTPAQWETLKLVAAGYSTRRIALELGIGEEAVRGRIRRLLDYFDASSRMAIVVLCYREGII